MGGAHGEKGEHGELYGYDSSDSESQSSDDNLNVKTDTDYIHFVNAYSKHPKLQEAGLTLIVDHSGRIAKRPTIKDVVANRHVVMATIQGSLSCENRAPQMSAYTLQRALLQWYTKQRLFPHGLSALIPAVSDWALKNGAILKKLVSRFRRLLKKATRAKNKKLQRMKDYAVKIGWPLPKDGRGNPGNLSELPDIRMSSSKSSVVSGLGSSEVSTQSSIMAKLVRVADQLKAFEVGKSSGDASPKDSPPVTDASSKTKENQITKGSRSNRLAEIFRISKLRRLSGAPRSDPVSPEQKHPDGESGPPGVPDFVMKSLGNGAPVPKAFPLHSQYVANMKASREAAAEREGNDHAVDSSGDEVSEKPRKSKKKRTQEARNATTQSGSPWNYNSVRLSFIHAAKKDKGLNYKQAKELWDNSQEKKQILAPVPLAELKRRKFVAKSCNANPWAKLP